jgi:hypothetical protein
MASKFLSLKSSLTGNVVDFLNDSQMPCLATQQGVVELVNSLSHYTEEGQILYPKIYVFDNEDILDSLVYVEKFPIGQGPRIAKTFAEGLKKVAPLAIESWNIYFKRGAESIEYGLFKSGESIISVSPWELLINNGQKEQPVFFIQQVGEGLIELKSWNNTHLLVSFGIKDIIVSPTLSLESFVKHASTNVDSKFIEQYNTVLTRILNMVTQKQHGTIAVIFKGETISDEQEFKDGQILKEPINLVSKLQLFRTESDRIGEPSLKHNSDLISYTHLISGMMLSDGITIFSNSGLVLAYNVFIKTDKQQTEDNPQDEENKIVGGARTRAFNYLCKLPKDKISAVLMQSQDGAIKFFENER